VTLNLKMLKETDWCTNQYLCLCLDLHPVKEKKNRVCENTASNNSLLQMLPL